MMNCIIIDDEPLARSIIKEYLQHYSSIHLQAECGDGFEAAKLIQQYQPDLLFLDIQMPKINGFELLELVETNAAIIFTTAFEEFAIKAFEQNAFDYLLKPFSRERFDKAIQKVLSQKVSTNTGTLLETLAATPQETNRIVVKDGSKIKIIPVTQVHYLEAADDYVKIVTKEGNYLKKKTMQYFEQTLSQQQFARIHRSYMVNLQLITKIELYEKENYAATLSTGQQLPVSKSGYMRLKFVLGI
ncbi:LytTR family transcriptional regulator DNA-binding domain-containing protein [Hydrotalea sp.]|uniref:LytR/AlgR family response regulator transcription factor n=1 Tax=Hydrotalea sp. TaxID=2881279 RepID=UPI00260A248A|nr:LytTR family transcriptional regulator DNA-binding domain-containing protein [Hydrotalea sp.]